MCLCCRGKEDRGKRHVTGETQTLEIVFGKVETLATFLIGSGGAHRREERMCVSLP